jgi:hypothetical protein
LKRGAGNKDVSKQSVIMKHRVQEKKGAALGRAQKKEQMTEVRVRGSGKDDKERRALDSKPKTATRIRGVRERNTT